MVDGGEQHTTGTAGGVVYRLAFLGVEDLNHHPHHAAGGVELSGLVATGDVGELADEWRWSYSGESLGRWSPDLQEVEMVVEGSFVRANW